MNDELYLFVSYRSDSNLISDPELDLLLSVLPELLLLMQRFNDSDED